MVLAIINAQEVRARPLQVDSEDARSIMTAYINNLSCSTELKMQQDPLPLPALIVGPVSAETASQDLLPIAIERTLDYAWSLQLGRAGHDLGIIVNIILVTLTNFLCPTGKELITLSPSTRLEIIETIHKRELLDWVARALIRFDPVYLTFEGENLSLTLERFTFFLQILVADVEPRTLETTFRDYVFVWCKFNMHLKVIRYNATSGTPGALLDFYQKAEQAWLEVAHILGLMNIALEQYHIECHNPRCHYGYIYAGAKFICPEWNYALYCDSNCQSAAKELRAIGVAEE
ncbi:hypothetical protein RSAG8_11422, partial [Rhizoctonia solani AG-8 WAC10335]